MYNFFRHKITQFVVDMWYMISSTDGKRLDASVKLTSVHEYRYTEVLELTRE